MRLQEFARGLEGVCPRRTWAALSTCVSMGICRRDCFLATLYWSPPPVWGCPGQWTQGTIAEGFSSWASYILWVISLMLALYPPVLDEALAPASLSALERPDLLTTHAAAVSRVPCRNPGDGEGGSWHVMKAMPSHQKGGARPHACCIINEVWGGKPIVVVLGGVGHDHGVRRGGLGPGIGRISGSDDDGPPLRQPGAPALGAARDSNCSEDAGSAGHCGQDHPALALASSLLHGSHELSIVASLRVCQSS